MDCSANRWADCMAGVVWPGASPVSGRTRLPRSMSQPGESLCGSLRAGGYGTRHEARESADLRRPVGDRSLLNRRCGLVDADGHHVAGFAHVAYGVSHGLRRGSDRRPFRGQDLIPWTSPLRDSGFRAGTGEVDVLLPVVPTRQVGRGGRGRADGGWSLVKRKPLKAQLRCIPSCAAGTGMLVSSHRGRAETNLNVP